ncbi:hypothetical protein FHU41_002201 [Psychromicrobium silvestre]|uniref:Uncharacterized protein n=1 Tax=Psychromicrobium silvestre TaxID=1645614 RepID=A0A7Y9LUQ5_9MICC|nr:hypothetical protein [Psychromicrobium silvestre]
MLLSVFSATAWTVRHVMKGGLEMNIEANAAVIGTTIIVFGKAPARGMLSYS